MSKITGTIILFFLFSTIFCEEEVDCQKQFKENTVTKEKHCNYMFSFEEKAEQECLIIYAKFAEDKRELCLNQSTMTEKEYNDKLCLISRDRCLSEAELNNKFPSGKAPYSESRIQGCHFRYSLCIGREIIN